MLNYAGGAVVTRASCGFQAYPGMHSLA